MSHVLGLALVCAALVTASASCVPAIHAVLTQLRDRGLRDWFYVDADGHGTPETITRFSNRRNKVVIGAFSALGLAASVIEFILEVVGQADFRQKLEAGLYTITWGVVLVHGGCLAAHRSPTTSYDLALLLLPPAIFLALLSIWKSIQHAQRVGNPCSPAALAWAVSSITAFFLALASTLLPRRPDVFFDGYEIDRQRTICAIGRYTWSWIEPTILKASTNIDLDGNDIPRPDHRLRSEDLRKNWGSLRFQKRFSIALALAYKGSLILLWTVTIVRCLIGIMPFWAMLRILEILEYRDTGASCTVELLCLILGMAVSNLIDAWLEGWLYWSSVSDLSLPIRALFSGLVFAKLLRRKDIKAIKRTSQGENVQQYPHKACSTTPSSSSSSLQESEEPGGAILNLVGVDTERIAYFLQFQFLIVNGIIRIAVFSVFLGRLLGWIPLIAGLSAWLMLLPGSVWFSNRLLANSKTLMHLRDGKLAKIYEAISGIRQIKFSALETQWEERILAHRYKELQSIRKYFVADSALFGCMILGQIILAAASLTVYVFINDGLAPSVAFVSISMFNTLESTLGSLPELITLGLDTLVSLRRIEAHLLGPEIQNNLTPAPTISFQGATVSWPTESEASDEARFCLRDLSLSFPVGCLSVISGKAGSGKSLLLSAILGEADLLEGSISVPPALQTSCPSTARMENWTQSGSVAYVAQNPWLTNGSLRNNILFGLPFNQQRYDQVVEATSLRHDFSVLTDGDATEIGENGVNLSGGQKWRVTLARAIYSRAEILILDDIFCAVDATVGRSILDKCLNGTLCKGRTRILVTHNVDLVLPITDYIVELGGGKVTYRGRPQYRSSQPTASQNEGHDVSTTSNSSPVPGDTKEDALMNTGTDADDNPPAELMSPPHIPRIYVHEEQRASGTVKKQVYLAYLGSSGGMRLWCTCIIVFLTYQFCILGRGWWVRIWSAASNPANSNGTITMYSPVLSLYSAPEHRLRLPSIQLSVYITATGQGNSLHRLRDQNQIEKGTVDFRSAQEDTFFYLIIYILISVATAIFGILRFFWIYFLAIRASRTMFDRLLITVIHAPLQWFDTTPAGRILNRFTADFNIIDQRVPLSWAMFFTSLFRLAGICAASLATSLFLIPPASLILLIGTFIAKRYLAASRPLKRLESTSRSPLFSLFTTTSTGLTTIRAFQKSPTYVEQMHKHLDTWTMATFYSALANRWMSFRMAVVGTCFCMAVGILIVLNNSIDAALAGFILSFVLDFSESIRWTIRCYGDMELDMNAMERVTEYMDLEVETDSGIRPPASWPTSGAVQVKDLDVAYGAEMPLVLKGVSFIIASRERIGVVGRTGAGKSSLALALVRCLEMRAGSIMIDGLDISTLALHDLRSRIAIIPQDPVLFSGTIRTNLDPTNSYSDTEIADVLSKLHLINSRHQNAVNNRPQFPNPDNPFSDLQTPISPLGTSLSPGQRQLVTIARTLLSHPKLVIFDEATSAIDVATDTLVQQSLRECFNNSTLIVIAHRLSTIYDFDQVLVLDGGRVAEYGRPAELRAREGSLFQKLCKSSKGIK